VDTDPSAVIDTDVGGTVGTDVGGTVDTDVDRVVDTDVGGGVDEWPSFRARARRRDSVSFVGACDGRRNDSLPDDTSEAF
jgi:hypothetical protein